VTLDLIHAQTWPAHRERGDFRALEREKADMEPRRVICARCGKRSRLMDGAARQGVVRDTRLHREGRGVSEALIYDRDRILRLGGEAAYELMKAIEKFPTFNSPHEGWAVIKEELDELWKHVMENTARGQDARKEAIQIAAMGLRYALDLCGPKLTHGRHCPCTACRQEDWTRITAPCGMHGPACPAVYDLMVAA